MAKSSGGVRTYASGTSTYKKRKTEIAEMRASGNYARLEMGTGGGYLAIEKSNFKHKLEEIKAGTVLANKGYIEKEFWYL